MFFNDEDPTEEVGGADVDDTTNAPVSAMSDDEVKEGDTAGM